MRGGEGGVAHAAALHHHGVLGRGAGEVEPDLGRGEEAAVLPLLHGLARVQVLHPAAHNPGHLHTQ